MQTIKYSDLKKALHLLNNELNRADSAGYNLIICGGTALNATNLISRTTKDVDILALCDEDMKILDPEPLPSELINAALSVAENLGLPSDWLNNGPSHGDGGIFRLGLPPGLPERLTKEVIGNKLIVYYISRIDQIFFKLYAAVDQFGGYHAVDLEALAPTAKEILMAAEWSMTHDISDGYRLSVKSFLEEFGYEKAAEKI